MEHRLEMTPEQMINALNSEVGRLRRSHNFLLNTIYEAGDLLDAGQLIDASNKLDEAKFKYSLEKVSE